MKVIVNGLAIEYQDAGRGPLLLLLHGWGSDHRAFAGLAAELQQNYRVISVDLPGFGSSDKPKTDWHVHDYAQFTRQFLHKVAPSSGLHAVLGHSFGGRVIIKSLAYELIQPSKVILMGSAGIKPKKTLKQYIVLPIAKAGKALLLLPGLQKMAEPLRTRLYGKLGSTDYLNAEGMRQIFLNTINEDLRDDAAKNNLPTLLIWGADDTDTPLEQGQELQSLMANSELVVMPGAGHYVFLDKPQEVTQKIKEFLGA